MEDKTRLYRLNSVAYVAGFIDEERRKVRRSKPVAGSCSRCGRGASVADIITQTRFCYVPFYCKSWKAIMCTFCGAILKSYA